MLNTSFGTATGYGLGTFFFFDTASRALGPTQPLI